MNPLLASFRSLIDSRWTPVVALFAGAANVLAFAPLNSWWVQALTMAWLFAAISTPDSFKRPLLTSWLFGLAWSAVGVHWLYISMHYYGAMAPPMAALAVLLLAAYLGLFPALAVGCALWLKRRWKCHNTTLLLVLLPATWTLSEWLRGWAFTGFPWLTSGYAHSTGPFSGLAPVFGVYGLSWISVLLAGALIVLLRKRTQSRATSAFILLLFVAGLSFKAIDWTHPQGEPITVRLLQGNIPQDQKFSNETLLTSLMMYDTMIRQAPADLIAIPETAIPVFPQQLPQDYLPGLGEYARASRSHLALGIPLADGPGLYANSVIGIHPESTDSQAFYRYDKHHLVPFGEFVPWGFRWFVDMLDIPLGDMTRGSLEQPAFAVKDQWVMPNICYEDLFGEEIAGQLAAASAADKPLPSILLNVSNIAWFGDSMALPQHLQISQMRALETGRPMLRATNTGMTAVIGPKGQVLAQLPAYTRGTLDANVQGYQGQTPYIWWGNKLIIFLAFLALGLVWLTQKRLMRK